MRSDTVQSAIAALLLVVACSGPVAECSKPVADDGNGTADPTDTVSPIPKPTIPDPVGITLAQAKKAGRDVVYGKRNIASAVVPQPGYSVFAESVLVDGSTDTLFIQTLSNGMVIQSSDATAGSEETAAAESTTTATGSNDPCSDDAYILLPFKWNRPYDWYFNAGSTPSYLDVEITEDTIRDATINITHSYNTCGLADQVGATSDYKGRTGNSTDISTSATCGRNDGVSVTAFGDLPSRRLAHSCTWYANAGSAVESDTLMNKADNCFYIVEPFACSSRFSIEATMTHELGHTYGLEHVSESAHPLLTMSTEVDHCDDSASSLGWGDVRGLRAKY